MENIILVKYSQPDLENLEEDSYYLIKFEISKASVIFPGPKYIKKDNNTIEYYSDAIYSLDKKDITIRYKGISPMTNEHLFEIDIKEINREIKLNQILNEASKG